MKPMSLQTKRIVVTGGAGFLGSHLVDALKARGCRDVTVVRSREYDLVDRAATRKMYGDLEPNLVFHLAAQVGGIGANQQNPGKYFYDNLMMGTHVIEEGRRRGVEKIIVLGTICSYPKHARVPFRESELWDGYPEETNAPYGIAKKALLVMAQAYRQQYGTNAIVLLPVNLFGPRDNFDLQTSHVVPAMIRKFIEARASGSPRVTLWGDGTPTREFLYVEDCASALVLAAESYDGPDPVNVGAGFEISMAELAERVRVAVGYEGRITWDTTRPNGQPRRLLDTSKAAELFGFEAKVSFEEGLERTVRWYRSEHGEPA